MMMCECNIYIYMYSKYNDNNMTYVVHDSINDIAFVDYDSIIDITFEINVV